MNRSQYRITEDRLLIRYLITDVNGTIIEDTRAEPDSNCSITGYYIDQSSYVLSYGGKDYICGQSGNVYIWMAKNTNNTQMKLFLALDHVLLNSVDCPNGRAPQVLPLQQMLLIKQ